MLFYSSAACIAQTMSSSYDKHEQMAVTTDKALIHVQIPRGLDNNVAIDLITQHIKWRLSERVQSRSNAGRSL